MIHSQASSSTVPTDTKGSILLALERASKEVLEAIVMLEGLMSQPRPDTSKITWIRLELAHSRLTHGSIVYRIAEFLDKRGASSETAGYARKLQLSHSELMRRASLHTKKWSVPALEADWMGYCSETRKLLFRWTDQIKTEGQRLRIFLLQAS